LKRQRAVRAIARAQDDCRVAPGGQEITGALERKRNRRIDKLAGLQ